MTLYPFRLIHAWRVALLVVVACCATPGRAAAGCGDYVTVRTAAGEPAHQPGPPPCHGPHCSAHPDTPAPPPAPVVPPTHQSKEPAHTLVEVGRDARPFAAFAFAPTSSRPIHRAAAIFHPPRFS